MLKPTKSVKISALEYYTSFVRGFYEGFVEFRGVLG